ncbi:Hcp family type VI secretion system effector [Edaphovirga cremea]|uniref:Hcp family type VI secretion system effector n=1 Tax=Edaphovirga cremea TaxID=2267246 RepID=UPI000DEF5734|nr:Hcp family type VI secretion system effector [Edaphovirga cremea]
MSNLIYASVKGKKQGLISAGCSSLDSIGNRCQIGHEDQIQVLGLNHSISREQNVAHHPVHFTKPIDKSSPLLGVAISENELVDVVFYFYRVDPAGQLELYYEVKLTEASIVDVTSVYPHSIDNNEMIPYEKVQLKYKSIAWNHRGAGTSGYSIWEDRVY